MADWIDREIDANFDKARARGAAEREGAPCAVTARYSAQRGVFTIAFDNGTELSVRPAAVQGLEGAADDELADIELTPGGFGLLWPKANVAHSVAALLADALGTKLLAQAMATVGGLSTSAAKAQAARANGAKGGRPPRQVVLKS